MKRAKTLAALLCALCMLTACTGGRGASSPAPSPELSSAPTAAPTEAPTAPPVVVQTAKVLESYRAGDSISVLAYFTESGEPFTCTLPEGSKITPGDTVEVTFDGELRETYPAQLTAQDVTLKEPGNDYYGVWLAILTALWEEDPGLNDDADYFGFDLTGLSTLNAQEARILGTLFSQSLGKIPLFGTYEELVEQGYINDAELYWEDGLLFTLAEDSVADDRVGFQCSKWRSGLGAIFYEDSAFSFNSSGGADIEWGPMYIS